jgi:hypothetical protein
MSNSFKGRFITTAYDITGSKAIVGSGMTGLWLARLITDAGTNDQHYSFTSFLCNIPVKHNNPGYSSCFSYRTFKSIANHFANVFPELFL